MISFVIESDLNSYRIWYVHKVLWLPFEDYMYVWLLIVLKHSGLFYFYVRPLFWMKHVNYNSTYIHVFNFWKETRLTNFKKTAATLPTFDQCQHDRFTVTID